MSVPSSFFDTSSLDSTAGLNTSGLGTNLQPYDPMGQLNESDLISGASTDGGNSTQLPPVNISGNLGTIDPSSIGNPFAGANGGPPITASNFNPSLQNISFNQSGLDASLQQELGLTGAGGAAPASTPSHTFSGSNLLNDAALFGLGAYGLSQAKSAQSQTNSELAPLFGESKNLLSQSQNLMQEYNSGQLPAWAQSAFQQMNSEGTNLISNYNEGKLPSSEQTAANNLNATASNLLKQYQSGNLPGWAQQYVDWTSQQASSLINSNMTQALQTMAVQNFTDYTSGKLKPGDQVALTESVQAQKQRIASILGASGNADSSVLAAQYQQIDNQAAVTKQQVLNSYFQTGDQAYNSWLNTNAEAAQIKAQGAQFANTVFTTMLGDALQTQEFAANYTAQGLQAELQAGLQSQEYANTYKEKTFTDMLNSAYQGASIGDAALTQAIGIQIQSDNNLSKMVGDLMQSIATAYSYNAYANRNGGGNGTAPSSSGGGGSVLSDIVGGVSAYNGITGALHGIGSMLGFSSAGGAAAAASLPAGMSAALGGGATGAELGTTSIPTFSTAAGGGGAAASSGGGGAAMGAGAGAATAVGLAALPVLAGMLTPPVQLDQQYWTGLQTAMNSGDPGQIAGARGEILQEIATHGWGSVPYSKAQLAEWGITPQTLAEAFPSITSPLGGKNSWEGNNNIAHGGSYAVSKA